MDKRRVWREQEQRLVERWNEVTTRYQGLHAEISRQASAGVVSPELTLQAERARADVEVVRRQVARMKVEFNSGKRF